MRRLDQHGLPWRRAYATDPREWSVANQLGSLLQACGGHPYSVTLAGGECLPWSIGIDLSKRQDVTGSCRWVAWVSSHVAAVSQERVRWGDENMDA